MKKRQLARLKASLENGFPVDSTNEHGNTALMMACKVIPIMYTSTDFNGECSSMTPPPLGTFQSQFRPAIELLLTFGAKINMQVLVHWYMIWCKICILY